MSVATEALNRLSTHFGHSAFREGQADVVRTVLEGRDSLVVMPTGTGKSVCYQLPATMLDGITLVISPLVALMKDQVDSLAARGIAAAFVNSTLGPGETARRLEDIRRRTYKLVYVTPERFRNEQFISAAIDAGVSLFAVDEAHCISHWGHDFRPDYLTLRQSAEKVGRPPIIALTATATPRVRADIATLLGLNNPAVFVTGFDRPNLRLRVLQTAGDKQKLEILKEILTRTAGDGIIYTATRRSVEQVTSRLKIAGFAVEAYHAGLTETERSAVQDRFMASGLKAIVATNAFGMGIDKQDIRFVVHYHVPGSIEAYYQEIGRAGRDGDKADCILLFNYADTRLQRLFIEGGNPSPELVHRVYDQLAVAESTGDTPSAAQIGKAIGLSGDMAVRSALNVLEKAGHIQRGDRMDGPAIVTVKIPSCIAIETLPESTVEGLVLRHLLFQHGAGDKESIEIDEQETGHELGLGSLRVRDALSRLASIGVISRKRPEGNRPVRLLENASVNGLRIDAEALNQRLTGEQQKLRSMVDYCYYRRCLREYLLRYFGENNGALECGNCSSCNPAPKEMTGAGKKGGPGGGILTIPGSGLPSQASKKNGSGCQPNPVGDTEPAAAVARFGAGRGVDDPSSRPVAALSESEDEQPVTPRRMTPRESANMTEILRAVSRLDGRFGKGTIAAFLAGSDSAEVIKHGLARITGYGSLREVSPREINSSFRSLVRAGCVGIRADGYPTVRITRLGRDVLENQEIELELPVHGRKE